MICCNNCNAKDSIITDHLTGEVVCNQCGEIYEGKIYEESNSKTLPLIEPIITMEIKDKDETRTVVNHPKKTKISKNYKKIEKFLSSYNISYNLIEKIKKLYNMIALNKNMQGRNFKHVIIALYFHALRSEKIAKSLKEITKMFPSVTERQIRKAYNSIKCLVVNNDEIELNSIEKNYIELYLGGNIEKYRVKMLAYEIINNINYNDLLEGKHPSTVAGLALILAYKLLNDYSDNNKQFFQFFANKSALMNSLYEIKGNLDKIIPQQYKDELPKIKN